MSNEFDAAVAATLQPDQGQAARVGFSVAADTNPDAYAEAQRVARRTGVPVDTVFAMPQEMKRQDAIGSIDFGALAKTSPATASLLADVEKAKIAHDNVGSMSAIEATLRPITRAVRSAAAGVTFDLSSGFYGLFETGFKLVAPLTDPLAGTILPENPLRRVAAGFEGIRKNQEGMAKWVAGDQSDAGFIEQSVNSGFRSFGQMAPGMAGTVLTGNPAFALGSAGALQGSQSATKALDAGKTPLQALAYGAQDATAEVATEMIPMGRLLKDLKVGAPFFKVLGHQIATEVPTEMAATAWQNFNEWANLNPDKPFSSYLEALPEAEAQTILATVTTSVLTAGMGKGVHSVVNRMQQKQVEAGRANQTAELLASLNQLAAADKVLQRDPQTFQEWVGKATEDSPVQQVFIDANTLMQSGVADQVAAVSPAVAQQLPEALQTGGTIAIPVDEYTARIAPTEYAQSLLDHLKTYPEGFSRAEAQQYMQSHAEELKAEVERTLAEKQGDDTFKQSAEAVRAEVKAQLDAAARFTPQVNDAYSSMVSNFFAVQAAKLGITPQEMFQRYPLKVGAERIDGQQFDQNTGPFGPVLTDFKGDAQGAIANAFEQTARGSFNPATLSITLLKNADLSTFLHESGHFFLEVQFDVASKLEQEADIFGPDTLKPAEAQMLKDTRALLNWFGVDSVAEWYNLDFEEKRAYHEQFARGFEAYLFEGTSPSIEMQGLFQRFRAWLLNVYRDLKSLNVELTPEVRGVFDRMLATSEQITLAEQGRSMMPLFNSAQEAGMTPEEFAAYQALGVDATNTAIQDLQARGLRDMTWLHNARGRIIKQLQKEAKAQRTEVQMDVRREVMSQPIYRAWHFLTGKLTAEDKIEAPAKRTSGTSLDETQDSLFAAIAKLGGLNRAAVQSEWGIDPKERIPMPAFGKHVLRREGGMSIDSMGEALGQYGYLTLDEHGKHDLHELEDKFFEELRGAPQYSYAHDYAADQEMRAGDQVANPQALGAARLDIGELKMMGLPDEVINALKTRRMTANTGLHPDIVAEMFGFTSGDELVRKLAQVETPKAEIDALTDVRMLEQFGDLSSPEAIEKAADKAIHNDARARFVATEANALERATGQRKTLASAAKMYAKEIVARLKIRNIKPGQYASAEVRAAKAADKASKSGDLGTAAAEKRNQLIQNYATRAAYDAQEEVDKGLRYLKKFEGDIKGLDADYADQIGALLERFDLRKGQSNKAVDKRTALAEWIKAQREAGLEPDISTELENEAFRTSYKNLTVEEFRGLVDAVRQIEHLGRLKHKLLTAADQRAYEAVRDEIAASIHEHAQGREADTRTPTTNMGRAVQGLKRFWASHIKAATWARVMDGGKDGGPVWEYFVRNANERGDMETTLRAEATAKLSEILAPVFKLGRMGGKGQFFPSIGRSLNREARLAIAMNMGNEGNIQRLLGGEGWSIQQLVPVLQSLTAQEWHAVQAVWDHFESYRPQIAAKERRIYGKEPEWVEPQPFAVTTADGTTVQMRGGYYPIKYDPAASQRAEEHADAESAKRQLQGAYTTATTRRSFTKARAEAVQGRPLLYTLSGLYSGVNDVIHDLSWHEWLIDTNRLLRSHTIDQAIREHYGPEAKQQFKTWAQDIAEGEKGGDAAVDLALSRLRQGISASGLGFNVMSALMQPLGITQSITRVGAEWVGRGVLKYVAAPIDLTRQVNEMSEFMANRARTRFRELNELRNQVQDQSAFKEMTGRYAYFLMMRCQQMVDVPTWWGAYEKAIAAGNEETRAVALADQAVIDAQGGGQTKDLSAIERGGPAQKLFTVFYSFMNTALNLGIDKTMSADTPAKRAKLAADYALLYVVPAVLGYFLKAALTPGDAGDDDPEKIAKKLLANQIDYLMGLMVVVREFGEAAKIVAGANDMGRDYTGPAGLRLVADTVSLAKQAHQGEFDDAFRKAAVNVVGDLFGLPSAQINRTITGTKALAEDKTDNPAAVAFGFQEKR